MEPFIGMRAVIKTGAYYSIRNGTHIYSSVKYIAILRNDSKTGLYHPFPWINQIIINQVLRIIQIAVKSDVKTGRI